MNASSSAPGLLSRSSNRNKRRNIAFDYQEAIEICPLGSPPRLNAGLSVEEEYAPMDQDSLDANEAILHYDPGSALRPVSPPSQSEDSDEPLQPAVKKHIKRGRKPKSKTEAGPASADTQSHPSANTTQEPPSTRSKLKSKAKDKKRVTVLTEEDVHHRLRDRILADTQLYLRILRYEPLPLDPFVQLLCGDDVKVTGALKAQVRSFLDKQVSP